MTTGGAANGSVDPMTFPKIIGVIGAGTMGTGIVQVCTLAGLSTVMMDVDAERVARGREAVASGLERLLKKAKLSAVDRDAALGRLRGTTDDGALRTCDFIISRRHRPQKGTRLIASDKPAMGEEPFSQTQRRACCATRCRSGWAPRAS